MRLWFLITSAALTVSLVGCGSSGDEPTASQKVVVPEAKDGKPVAKPGDQFTRTSDRN